MATEKDSRGEYLQLQQHKVKFQTQSNFAKQKRSLNQRSQVQLITQKKNTVVANLRLIYIPSKLKAANIKSEKNMYQSFEIRGVGFWT